MLLHQLVRFVQVLTVDEQGCASGYVATVPGGDVVPSNLVYSALEEGQAQT